MNKKQIQRKRIMAYFVDATAKIIEAEGYNSITIRKVADLAGYNSATLYNYFENLDHLVFFASMKFIKEYALNLENYIKNASNSIEKFKGIWECFCYYSFNKPKVYYSIFFAKLNNEIEDYVKDYYDMFPEDLGIHQSDVSTMLLKHNIYERGMTVLESCVKEYNIDKEELEEVNEMILLIYQGILLKVIDKKIDSEKAIKKTVRYINKIIDIII